MGSNTEYKFTDLFNTTAFIKKEHSTPQHEVYKKLEAKEFTTILIGETKPGYLLALIDIIEVIQRKLKIYGVTFVSEENAAIVFAAKPLSIIEQLEVQVCIHARLKKAFDKVNPKK